MPEGEPDRLPEYLFARLAAYVGEPVIAGLFVDDWPAVMIRCVLDRVETISETAYLHFDDRPKGTYLVVPAEGLRSISQPPGEPDVMRLQYANATVSLRNMDPEARVARWRTAIAQAGEMDPPARRSHLELIEQMLHEEAAQTNEPHRGQLEHLLERVMFLLRPFRADELYPGREDDDDEEDDDFGW